uniref:Uncharacterized protein MANES_14G132200 n=1 Tax=Rhizophora mucronata TaxID=61149 RepID=A0A2P2LBN0_RHIMU
MVIIGLILEDSVAGSGRFLRVNKYFQNSGTPKFLSLEVKATDSNQSTKPNSIVCADCDGNGKFLYLLFFFICPFSQPFAI